MQVNGGGPTGPGENGLYMTDSIGKYVNQDSVLQEVPLVKAMKYTIQDAVTY